MQARATVIIPTYGNALFARWAIKSVQQQTVKEIEICIICDGSPETMVSFFKDMGKEDSRIKVYKYPKSPRTGEPYRDIVIRETTGKIICYCCHDDLWLPFHIETLEKTLQSCEFTHSIHTFIDVPEKINAGWPMLKGVHWIDLKDPRIIQNMHGGQNFFGLTYGAHTRTGYLELKEGWTTTPLKDFPTDLYMWCKFLTAFGKHCQTTSKVTALNLQKVHRKDWSEQERDDELRNYFERIQNPAFLRKIDKLSFTFPPVFPGPLQKIKFYFYKKMRKLTQKHLRRRS
jgi:glycosyltransferase involved in cell wall biosynthesis